jgi:DNA-binding LytR/AlgR family response regulator
MSKYKPVTINGVPILKIGSILVNPADIKYIKGVGNYSILHFTNGDQKLACRTLKYIQSLLTTISFVRPSKSYLINKAFIKSVEIKNEKKIILDDDFEIGISRRNIPVIKEYFKL